MSHHLLDGYLRKPIVPAARGEEPHMHVKRVLAEHVLAIGDVRTLGTEGPALLFGVTRSRMADLALGRIDRFTCDSLINMLARAGCGVELRLVSVPTRMDGRRRHSPNHDARARWRAARPAERQPPATEWSSIHRTPPDIHRKSVGLPND